MSGHRTTERILDIMEWIGDHADACTFSDISSELDIPKSSLSPIIHTLLSRHYLESSDNQRFSVGFSAFRLGNCFLTQKNYLSLIEDILKDLTEKCKETSHYAILSDGDTCYIKKADSPQSIRMVSSIGNRLPAYGTALGKALLFDHTKEEIKKLYPDGLKPLTEKTVTDFDTLFRQLEEGKKTGFAYESEESNEYVRCIAVPIRKEGRIAAAISISVPVFRWDEEKEAMIRSLLTKAKADIEQLLASSESMLEE